MIFPEFENVEVIENEIRKNVNLPLFKEFAIDFDNGNFIYDQWGKNIIWEGNQALKVWVWLALQTDRDLYKIYSTNYGHEFESIIGQGYNQGLIMSEMDRLIRECVLTNPYIIDVRNVEVDFKTSKLIINVSLLTIYGEVDVNV